MKTYNVLYVDYNTDRSMWTMVEAESRTHARTIVEHMPWCYRVVEVFADGEE